MHRSVLLGTAIAAVAATIGPVQAGPAPADAGRVAVADLVFHLRHGRTLALELRAGALSGGNSLRVLAQRCDAGGACDPSTDAYQSQLPATALSISTGTAVADLRTSIAGHALHIQWRPDGSTFHEVGGFEFEGGTSGSDYDGSSAVTDIELDGRSCNGTGAVGNGAFADTSSVTGSPDYAPLSALHVPANVPLTC